MSDRYEHESEPDPSETGIIEFKDTPVWKIAYSELKEVLSGREHRKNK